MIDSNVKTLSFIDCAKSGFIKSVIASAAPATVLPAPNTARPAPIDAIAIINVPPSAKKSKLPPASSLIDSKVKTLLLILDAQSGFMKLVNASDIPPMALPAPKTARPVPMAVIAITNVPLSAKKSRLPPASSLIDNKVKTFFLILDAHASLPTYLFKESDNPAMALPAPKTARPKPIPVIARKNVPPSKKNSALPPTSSEIDNNVLIFFLTPSASKSKNPPRAASIAPPPATKAAIPIVLSRDIPFLSLTGSISGTC